MKYGCTVCSQVMKYEETTKHAESHKEHPKLVIIEVEGNRCPECAEFKLKLTPKGWRCGHCSHFMHNYSNV